MTAIGAVATGGTRGGLWESRGWMTGATATGAGATDRGNGAAGIGIASGASGRVRASEAGGGTKFTS